MHIHARTHARTHIGIYIHNASTGIYIYLGIYIYIGIYIYLGIYNLIRNVYARHI